jgi:hypothetical protein
MRVLKACCCQQGVSRSRPKEQEHGFWVPASIAVPRPTAVCWPPASAALVCATQISHLRAGGA